MQEFKPQRGRAADLSKLVYPVYVSTKVDGIRGNRINGLARTKSLKPISNIYTRQLIEATPVLEGCEFELTTTWDFSDEEAFNKATGDFRRFEGQPSICMSIFDIYLPTTPFNERYAILRNLMLPDFARVLPQHLVTSRDQLDEFIRIAAHLNHEGIMIRHHDSLYKCGMATLKGGQLLKHKFLEDDEAVVIGVEEGTNNLNEKVTNELGRSKRSSAQEGLVPSGLAGVILGQHPLWGVVRISGLKDDLAKDMLINTSNYLGLLATFRYQSHGTMEAPRQAKFKGFRDPNDMSLPETGEE